jgi:peptide/nickel transport system substrate-binding protein
MIHFPQPPGSQQGRPGPKIDEGQAMRVGRKRPAKALGMVVSALALSLAVSACSGAPAGSGGADTGAAKQIQGDANTVNNGPVKSGGSLTYVLEKNVASWNPLTPIGSTVESMEAVAGVMPSVYVPQPDMQTVKLNTNLVLSAKQTSTSPQTIVYKINPKAVWSDKTPISADDFSYLWKTQNAKDCPKCQVASTTGYDQIASVTGSDGGKTATVVFKKPFAAWQTLFSFLLPSHIAATYGDIKTAAGLATSFNHGFADKPPTWSGGPFTIKQFQPSQAVIEAKNASWYGSGPNLDQVTFRIITDTTQEVPALQNHEVQAIAPAPQVDLLSQLKQLQGVNYQVGTTYFWEHFEFNLNNPFLGQNPAGDALRQSMFTAVDTQGIIDRTVGQITPGIKPLNNHFFMPQQKGYQDNVGSLGFGKADVAKAKQILQAAGYTGIGTKLVAPDGKPVPALRFVYTAGNQLRQTEGTLFASYAKPLGITVNVEPTDNLGASQVHQDSHYDYDIIDFAWVGSAFPAAINAPVYLSCPKGVTYCSDNIANYRNANVDKLLKDSVTNLDPTAVAADLNKADKQISSDAVSLPLYQTPGLLAYDSKYGGIRANANYIGSTYNIADWGLLASGS